MLEATCLLVHPAACRRAAHTPHLCLLVCLQVGVTAMLIASKYEEIWAPELNDFVYISDRAYKKEQILTMEKVMLNALKFNLTGVSATSLLPVDFPRCTAAKLECVPCKPVVDLPTQQLRLQSCFGSWVEHTLRMRAAFVVMHKACRPHPCRFFLVTGWSPVCLTLLSWCPPCSLNPELPPCSGDAVHLPRALP